MLRIQSASISNSLPRGRATKLAAVAVFILVLIAAASFSYLRGSEVRAAGFPSIMFVTQPPFGGDFASANATFGNHNPKTESTPRGGDLYIRYSDGTLRNLTAEAGYGLVARLEIAVREPSVHWSGTKAVFSMVIGGTTLNDYSPVYWQIYEVSGLARGETVQFTRLPQQADANNVSPIYGTDDRIIFTSDRPRNGDRLTYPQLDEYESTATNTGIWSMNPDGSDLKLLDHAVSGDFTPMIASDGRIIFTRWDHLQRDQQSNEGTLSYGAFNYASESSAQQLTTSAEVYPELRRQQAGSYYHGHSMNQFFPWQMNEDGSGLETLNHIGRHELAGYFDSSHDGLPEFIAPESRRRADSLLQIKEDPTRPGYFFATRAPEFGAHAAGQIIGLYGAESVNPDNMQVDYVTDPISYTYYQDAEAPPSGHPGHFRNPTPLSDGSLIAIRATSPFYDKTTSGQLSSRYDFHLVRLQAGNPYWTVAERLVPSGIAKSISYWDNYSYKQVSYAGQLWELDPVEVRARPRPNRHANALPGIEAQILGEELGGQAGIDQFRAFLQSRNLALVVSRNVTRRADRQQDFNLKIDGSTTETREPGATPVEVAFMQFVQGDLIRGYSAFSRGRRPIGQFMHDGLNPAPAGAPPGSVRLGSDGSMAALVPARRALSWQMTKADGQPVVRERYWVTFAPGEMRSCANCHGINTVDTVLRQPPPANPPQALRDLARWYRDNFATTLCGSIAPTSQSFGAGAGSGNVTVTAPAGCNWTASSDASWITISSGASGSGDGSVSYSVAANSATNPRNGTITIAGASVAVMQAGATMPCSQAISPASQGFTAAGGSGSVAVTSPAGCSWTAVSNAAWISITSGASGSGAGIVGYNVAKRKKGGARTGTIRIAGQLFTVSQDGPVTACTFSLSSTTQTLPAGGGGGSVSVTTEAACAWSAVSNVSWIVVTPGLGVSGSGAVVYTGGANTSSSPRVGTLTVAGQTVTVTQAAAPLTCSYAISPQSKRFAKGGGSGLVSVSAESGCSWTAVSNVAWTIVTSGKDGSGSASVSFAVSANTSGTSRTGTLTIAGRTVTVKQSGT